MFLLPPALIPCQRASVCVLDETAGELTRFSADLETGGPVQTGNPLPFPDEGLPDRLRLGEILSLPDLRSPAEPLSPLARLLIEEEMLSSLVAPLMVRKQLIGAMTLSAGCLFLKAALPFLLIQS